KPVKDMILSSLLQNIQEKCEKFVASFIKSDINILSQKLSYNKECTYVTNIIISAIWATLKGLPLERSFYVST
ncbi:817_t:CDS:2, partial [Funneliformis geosporum]